MTWIRRNWFKTLFILLLFALPGADIECEDGDLEIDWPDLNLHHDYWYADPVYVEPVYVDPGPCCWFW